MIELYNIGISEDTINNMLELFPNIRKMKENEIKEKEIILEKIGCTNTQIINIIGSNPEYLTKSNSSIVKLIGKLVDLGFKTLNILFDSNPYILNLEAFEIDNYINKRKLSGEILEDIVDDLDSNTYLFNEV